MSGPVSPGLSPVSHGGPDQTRAEPPIVLGSGSPRRSGLMDHLGLQYEVRVAQIDERPLWTDDVTESAVNSAVAKFKALRPGLGRSEQLLTADTLVACRGRPLGKPRSVEDAAAMIAALSGQTVGFVSALVWGNAANEPELRTVTSSADLRELSSAEVDDYVSGDFLTGDLLGLAGALELQGAAGHFIVAMSGCWSNIIGLPVCEVTSLVTSAPARCPGSACGH